MSNITLFVFEGKKTEHQVADALKKAFPIFNSSAALRTVYCADIYQLYRQLQEDEFLDIVELIRERNSDNNKVLNGLLRSDITRVILFFDYDGHAQFASDQNIFNLLTCFNSETDSGSLYISYPMIEAIKHLQPGVTFEYEKIKIAGLSGSTAGTQSYKQVVGNLPDPKYRDFTLWTQQCCEYVITEHLKKANALVNGGYIYPNSLLTQSEIFEKQVEKHINPNGEVAVLSAFPLFLLDYYGFEYLTPKFN